MGDTPQDLKDWEDWMDRSIDASLRCLRTHHDLVLQHTQSLRPGHGCVIHYPTDDTGYKSGNMSLHLIVEWDDGKEWMLRIKHDASRSTQASRRLMIESEVAVMSYLALHGLPVPDAWSCPPLPMPDSGTVHMWCLMERMPGKPFSPWHYPDPDLQRNVASDLADFYIHLAALPLEGVGALCLDPSGEKGAVVIGPSDIYLPLRDDLPTEPPTAALLGPWPTSAEYHIARITEIIRQLPPDLLSCCLLLLEIRQMMEDDRELPQSQPTYICHGDPNGGHILIDCDGHITAIIDWEFCVTRPFAEAFQAPIGFIPIPDLEDGQVALSHLEDMLADSLREKGRTDLAECAVEGRKWHLLRVAPGHPTDMNLTNTFRRLWSGEKARQFETAEEWETWAMEQFKEAPELRRFLQSSQ